MSLTTPLLGFATLLGRSEYLLDNSEPFLSNITCHSLIGKLVLTIHMYVMHFFEKSNIGV